MRLSLPGLLSEAFRAHGDKLALGRRTSREAGSVTYRELAAAIRSLALGFETLGIRRGEHVALFAGNRREWLLADLALASLGAVDVPRGADAPQDELAFILRHAACRSLVAEDPALLERIREKTDLSQVRQVILMEGEAPGAIPLAEAQALGAAAEAREPGRFDERMRSVKPEDLLTIVYTSGTTANPKGVRLTHANLTANLGQLDRHLPDHARAGRVLSVLPTWHMFERTIEYFCLARGLEIWYSSIQTLREDMRGLRPQVIPSVPRIWETVHAAVEDKARKRGRLGRAVFRLAQAAGRLSVRRDERRGRSTRLSRATSRVLRGTVYRGLHAATGGRLELAVSGGGTLPRHVDEFFLGAGITLINGYGLTETAPILAARRPAANVPGTIGWPVPDTEFRLLDEAGRPCPEGATGRLQVRGPQVMEGYHDNPAATAAVLSAGGWFDTGDLVQRRPDGQWVHRGRAKETLVLRGGENVEPADVETRLTASPLIEQALVFGQDAKILAALLVPHLAGCQEILGRDLAPDPDGELADPGLRDLVQDEVRRLAGARAGVPAAMRVGPFALLAEPFSPGNGLLTQTLKMKRAVILEHHRTIAVRLLERAGAPPGGQPA